MRNYNNEYFTLKTYWNKVCQTFEDNKKEKFIEDLQEFKFAGSFLSKAQKVEESIRNLNTYLPSIMDLDLISSYCFLQSFVIKFNQVYKDFMEDLNKELIKNNLCIDAFAAQNFFPLQDYRQDIINAMKIAANIDLKTLPEAVQENIEHHYNGGCFLDSNNSFHENINYVEVITDLLGEQ